MAGGASRSGFDVRQPISASRAPRPAQRHDPLVAASYWSSTCCAMGPPATDAMPRCFAHARLAPIARFGSRECPHLLSMDARHIGGYSLVISDAVVLALSNCHAAVRCLRSESIERANQPNRRPERWRAGVRRRRSPWRALSQVGLVRLRLKAQGAICFRERLASKGGVH